MKSNTFARITLRAGEDLSTKQYHLVKVGNDGKVYLCGNNEVAVGVVENKPLQNEACAVNILGTTKAIAGGNITAGSKVISNSAGKVVALPITAGVYNVFGIALDNGTEDAEIEVLIRPETVEVKAG